MHRAVGLLLLGGLIASGQGYISEVVVDFAVKLMRNYWKRNSMDPDVINNFSRMYKNIFMNTSMNVTVSMVTDEYVLKGISNVVRDGDVDVAFQYPKVFVSVNLSAVFLRVYFNYAVNYEDNVSNKSWTNFGRNEYFISGLDIGLQLHLDLKSQRVELGSLAVDGRFKMTVGEEFRVGSIDETPVEKHRRDSIGVLNNAHGRETLRRLMEDRYRHLVEGFLKTLSDEMI